MTQNRIAVITGASSGIGAATARALAAEGARVALIARRADRVGELAAELGGIGVGADVGDPDAVARAAGEIREQLGPPDLVVAGAGVMLPAPFEDARRDHWRRMLDANVAGLLHTAGAFTPDLLAAAAGSRPADLVIVSSIGAHQLFPGYGVYAATKAAATQLARNLRLELGPRGVRVSAIEPGLTRSELAGHVEGDARGELDGMFEQIEALDAADVADVIAFQVSRRAGVNLGQIEVVPTAQG
jgi:NADP-dependent 3-hydroxy acid dehydrogenase YdfG